MYKIVNKQYELNINFLICILLFLDPVFDNITGFMLLNGYTSNFSSILKSFILFMCILQILMNRRCNIKNIKLILFGLFLMAINFMFTYLYFDEGYIYNFNITIRLLNLFVLCMYFSTFKQFNTQILMNYYSWFYPLSLLVPTALGIGYHTYKYDQIGYKGFYYAGNEISIIMIIIVAYSLNRVIYNKNKVNRINLALNIICSILIGTKAIILACIVISIAYWLRTIKKRNIPENIFKLLVVFVLLFVIAICFRSYIDSLISIWQVRFARLGNKWFDFFLSARNIKLREAFDVIKNENKLLILLGSGAYFITVKNGITIEMDFFDLLSYYGCLIAIFLSVHIIHFIYEIKRYISIIQYSVIVCVFLIGFLAGHVLFAPAVSTVLAVYVYDALKGEKLGYREINTDVR